MLTEHDWIAQYDENYDEMQWDWPPWAECDMFGVRTALGLNTTPPTSKMGERIIVFLLGFSNAAQKRFFKEGKSNASVAIVRCVKAEF